MSSANSMDASEASEAIMQLEFPSFGEMLDMTIRNRVGNLIWAQESLITSGKRSVNQALVGVQPGQYIPLLSFSELRDLRLRNRLNQIMTPHNLRESVHLVRQSLARLGYDTLFAAIGVDIDVRYDSLNRHPHIVFVEQ